MSSRIKNVVAHAPPAEIKLIKQCMEVTKEELHPPLLRRDLAPLRLGDGAGGYYLMVNAFAPYKRVDLAVAAFNSGAAEGAIPVL